MIIDRIENAGFYSGLPARLLKALEFLSRSDLMDLPLGKMELDGDRLFALIQEYVPKPIQQGLWEAHRKYHDVQFVVRGVERMGYANAQGLTPSVPYDAQKEVLFYGGVAGDYVTVRPGCWVLFTPQDAHMPCIALPDQAPATVRKIVVKAMV